MPPFCERLLTTFYYRVKAKEDAYNLRIYELLVKKIPGVKERMPKFKKNPEELNDLCKAVRSPYMCL
jgi:hypothetical protein